MRLSRLLRSLLMLTSVYHRFELAGFKVEAVGIRENGKAIDRVNSQFQSSNSLSQPGRCTLRCSSYLCFSVRELLQGHEAGMMPGPMKSMVAYCMTPRWRLR